jgi:hypothetical protein
VSHRFTPVAVSYALGVGMLTTASTTLRAIMASAAKPSGSFMASSPDWLESQRLIAGEPYAPPTRQESQLNAPISVSPKGGAFMNQESRMPSLPGSVVYMQSAFVLEDWVASASTLLPMFMSPASIASITGGWSVIAIGERWIATPFLVDCPLMRAAVCRCGGLWKRKSFDTNG